MGIKEDIENLVLFDKKNILSEIDELKKQLKIEKQFNGLVEFIEDLDSVYLRNLKLETNDDEIVSQLKSNENKKLELWCYIKGKKKYIKSFGTIGKIQADELNSIFKFVCLIRLLKNMNEVSFYASKYHMLNS